jgi:hypothetical protein
MLVGFIGPVLIVLQIRREWLDASRSTLSPTYLAGFLLIYAFWFLYGLRFGRIAVWFGNLLAVLLQAALLALVLWK